ncbi:MAG TPA: KH domain-containing protein [Patescibacteria group bacterium]
MKQLIEYIVSNIVNHPENVVITETPADEKGVVKYLIEVNPEDVGRVIGKQGKVIKAIRQIVRIAAIQKGTRAMVDLKEEEGRISEDMGETSEEAVEEETAVATPEPEETPKDETKE